MEYVIDIEEPNDKQKLFLADKHKYVAFGGARGGGKSWAVRTKAKILAFKYPGIKQTIVRHSYQELEKNHVKPMIASLPYEVYKYNSSKHEMRFPNGSEILFAYCENDADLNRYQGTETDILYIDEATQYTEDQFKQLVVTVRGTNAFPKRVYLTCNPGGVGHGWVKRLFIDRHYNLGENPEEYSFIQSLVTDNKILMETNPLYVQQLEALPPKMRRAWLEGDWSIFEGQFFEEFRDDPEHYKDRRYTHVIEPFDIPRGWNIYRSFDFGYAKPFSCDWWAVDYDGCAYLILQLYGCTGEPNTGVKWMPHRIFEEIYKIEHEHPLLKGKTIIGVADPSIWDASRGESVEEVASKYGIYFSPGDNKRIAGWMQVHYRLAFDENGFPMVYFFNTCKAAIRTLPLLQYDDKHVEDLNTEGEDHFADSFRYFCMSRPITPRMNVASSAPVITPGAFALDLYK